ncbi:WG repeat-containing protein, partial [Eubacteriales bacterium DFI.9.88]|nr:WG repeat-containing protein [Eubacteriales bacterium DFI.9.88]
YSDGFCSAQSGSGYVLLNEDFQPVKEMEEAAAFHEGLAKIKEGKTLTYINKEGKAVIKKEAGLGSDFSEGIACIIRQQKGIFFEQEGNTLFTVPCYSRGGFADPEYPVGFQDGYCLWRGENGKYGYLDHEGKYVVPPCFDQAGA